jgi:hypothetical protein
VDTPGSETSSVVDETLWRLVKVCVSAAIRMAIDVSTDGKTLPRYSNCPVIERNNDGSFLRRSAGRTPDNAPNYGGIFGCTNGNGASGPIFYTYDQVPGYSDLKEYLTATSPYAEFYSPYRPVNEELLRGRQEIAVFNLVADLCDRYISVNDISLPINDESMREGYCRLERWISSSELPVDVLIPIIGSSFNLDQVDLGDCCIERLNENGLAQLWPSDIAHQHNWIYSVPSHCLVIRGFKFPNVRYFRWLDYTPRVELPTVVSRFFQALQLATGHSNVGYGHYGYRPVGWSNGFTADLEPLISGPIQEQYRRNDSVSLSPLAEDKYQLFVNIFCKLEGCEQNIKSAAGKYRSALLREDESDAIVDLCTALESILLLNESGEIIHRLALRVATIFSELGWIGCDWIASGVKQMYGHRSDIVHGNPRVGRKNVIKTEEDISWEECTALDLAELVVREVLIYAVNKQKLTGPEVDRVLLRILVEHARL